MHAPSCASLSPASPARSPKDARRLAELPVQVGPGERMDRVSFGLWAVELLMLLPFAVVAALIAGGEGIPE